MPRCTRYQFRSLSGSFALKKIPPIPVTRFKLCCSLSHRAKQLVRRRWPGRWSWTPARDWTHLENGSLAFSAVFRCHAIEPSVNENHIVDRFRAVVIICLPTEAVKALVIVTIGVDHEDSAKVIVAAAGGRAVELVAYQEKRAIGIFAIVIGFTKPMKQLNDWSSMFSLKITPSL